MEFAANLGVNCFHIFGFERSLDLVNICLIEYKSPEHSRTVIDQDTEALNL